MKLRQTLLTIAFLSVAPTVLAASGATDLGGLAENVTGTLTSVAKLITAASYIGGIGFALAGIVKFKAHQENPTQVHLSAPIILIAVAAALIFLPSIIQSAGQTVFQGSQTSGGATGQGLQLE